MASQTTERIIVINTQGAENSIKALREQVKTLTAAQRELDIESEEFAEVSKELAAAQGLLRNAMQGNTAAVEGSYKAYSQQLSVLREQRKWMREGTQEYIEATKKLSELDAKLKAMDAEIGVFNRNVGNYASAFNGLGSNVQNVAKEIPLLIKGSSDFFTATKEAIPALFESINGFRELAEEQNNTTTAMSTMIKSLFSWQTAILVVVNILAEYGDEIIAWAKGLINGAESLDVAAKAQKDFDKAIEDGAIDIGEQVVALRKMAEGYRELGDDIKDKEQFIRDNADVLGELGEAIDSVAEADSVLINNTDKFIKAMEARAKATAAEKLAAQAYEEYLQQQYKREQKQMEYDTMPAYIRDDRYVTTEGLQSMTYKVEGQGDPLLKEIAIIDAQMGETLAKFEAFFKMQGDFTVMADEILDDIGVGDSSTGNSSSRKVTSSKFQNSSTERDMIASPDISFDEGASIDSQAAIESARARIEAIKQMENASIEERKRIEEELQMELMSIEEQRLISHELNLTALLEDETLTADERIAIEERLTEAQLALAQQRMDADKREALEAERLAKNKQKVQSQAMSATSSLLKNTAALMKENSAAQKGIASAGIVMDTLQSAMAGWKSGMSLPPPAGPIIAAVNLATSLAMGAVQLKSLLSTDPEGGNASSVLASAQAPSVASSMPAAYTRNLMGDTEMEEMNKETKVYVVESEITEAQSASKARVESASF